MPDGGRGNDPHDLGLRPELLPGCHGLQCLEVPAGDAVSASVCRGRTSPSGTPAPAQGACSDPELLTRIEAVIEASPFNGEGYRKVWARLRADGVRTAMRRVRRIMAENSLLAPQRLVDREEHPHDGTTTTDRVAQMWGTDMTQTITNVEGRAYVLIAVDHCSGEMIGTHASSSASRWEALEPIRQGVAKHFGAVKENIAAGLMLRHDNGSIYLADEL